MMEGHFVDTLLDPSYRDTGLVYDIWKYFRGITAPTFFTISGFIFTYLLMKVAGGPNEKRRLKKGVKRGLLLLFLGYLLRTPILSWLSGDFSDRFFIVDVLHCIGLSLILIVGTYYLSGRNKKVMLFVHFLLWALIFLCEPIYRNETFEDLPLLLSNYLTSANGSVFTIIPWFGYMAFGTFMGILFHLYEKRSFFKWTAISCMIILGGVLFRFSSVFFNSLYLSTDIVMLKQIAYFNYLFPRLGDVLIIFSFLYALNAFLNVKIISKVGQKTLSIYVIHFIILYGSFTGIGLRYIIGPTLDPYAVTIGALIFIVVVCMLSIADLKTNQFFYKRWKSLLDHLKERYNRIIS